MSRSPARDAWSAGTRPKTSATSTETTSAKSSTPPSSRTSCMRGRLPSGSAWTRRTPVQATRSPSAPPIADSTKLSASTWRTSCMRPAPSAARTAISPRRLESLARIRFATFAQTMSSRKPTAAGDHQQRRPDGGDELFLRGDHAARPSRCCCPDRSSRAGWRPASCPAAPARATRRRRAGRRRSASAPCAIGRARRSDRN